MKRTYLIGIAVVVSVCLVIGIWTAIARRASHGRAIYERALALFKEGKTDPAAVLWKELVAKYPKSKYVDEALIRIGDFYQDEKKLFQAKESYEKVVTGYPASNSVRLAQEKLWDAKLAILFSPLASPDSIIYTVKSGDTLASIAKRFNTTADLIRKSNGIKLNLIRPRMRLKVSTAKYSMVVDKSKNTLTLKSNEEVLKVYQVSTGTFENPTPIGRFIIENRLVDPWWKNIPPTDPKNILGARWMGFQAPYKDYGIHGTTDQASIGKPITKGCVRMSNDDIGELYSIVPIGTEVIIVD